VEESRILTYGESMDILNNYGIPVAKGEVARSPEEAIEIARRIGYPVALKVISLEVSHKTEARAIKLDVKSDSELSKAYLEVTDNLRKYDSKAAITGVLIQEMLKNGTEVIVGISRDPQFGPVILFGLGGVFVEVLRDVSLRVLPITRYDADQMIKEIKGYRILEGFRERPRADVEAITNILLKVSKLSMDLEDSILEMDLNPVIVQSDANGAKVVDVRIVVPKSVQSGEPIRREVS